MKLNHRNHDRVSHSSTTGGLDLDLGYKGHTGAGDVDGNGDHLESSKNAKNFKENRRRRQISATPATIFAIFLTVVVVILLYVTLLYNLIGMECSFIAVYSHWRAITESY